MTVKHKPAPYTDEGYIEPGPGIPYDIRYKVEETPMYPNKWKCVAQHPYVDTNEPHLYHPTKEAAEKWVMAGVGYLVNEDRYEKSKT